MDGVIVFINVLKINALYVVNTIVMTQRKNGKIVNVVINFVLMTLVLKIILKIFTLIKNQIKQGEQEALKKVKFGFVNVNVLLIWKDMKAVNIFVMKKIVVIVMNTMEKMKNIIVIYNVEK